MCWLSIFSILASNLSIIPISLFIVCCCIVSAGVGQFSKKSVSILDWFGLGLFLYRLDLKLLSFCLYPSGLCGILLSWFDVAIFDGWTNQQLCLVQPFRLKRFLHNCGCTSSQLFPLSHSPNSSHCWHSFGCTFLQLRPNLHLRLT